LARATDTPSWPRCGGAGAAQLGAIAARATDRLVLAPRHRRRRGVDVDQRQLAAVGQTEQPRQPAALSERPRLGLQRLLLDPRALGLEPQHVDLLQRAGLEQRPRVLQIAV
jgi:hypothetical protein